MKPSTRRGALATVLGVGIAASFLPARTFAQSAVLGLPDGPMRFSRKIIRSLSDGSKLQIERSWRLLFTRQGQGIAVSGDQISVEVDAPPSLAELATIEQARSTDAIWPILLSDQGRILAAGQGIDEDDLAKAGMMARSMIESRVQPRSDREAQLDYLGQLLAAGGSLLAQLPADLFFPTEAPMRLVRPVDLPDGLTGEFEVNYASNAVPGKGWLDHAAREVITRLEGTEMRMREEWQMREL